jgi:uncharacterized SAM-binding protein YcdF (DUF218 family)
MRSSEDERDALAQIIWDYHHIGHRLAMADCIVALGSHDVRVAERAAELYREGWAPLIVCSGHLGNLTLGVWERSEAHVFAEVAHRAGVPLEHILIEDRATNTGENVVYSRDLLASRGIHPQRVIGVQKPYMERRTYATFRKKWPEVEVLVTSPQIPFADYPTPEITKDDVVHIMIGDLQRIMLYGEKGYQIPQDVPPVVVDAYKRLVSLGYTRHQIAEPAR